MAKGKSVYGVKEQGLNKEVMMVEERTKHCAQHKRYSKDCPACQFKSREIVVTLTMDELVDIREGKKIVWAEPTFDIIVELEE